MPLSNLHTHSHFSDGSSPPEDYLEEALRLGFRSIGFSDHSPLPFENTFALKEERTEEYCETILKLKKRYEGKIGVLLGMEVDYIPGVGHTPAWFRKHFPLDFIIGSVHLVKNPVNGQLWFIDGPYQESYDNGLENIFSGDIRAAVTAYYRQLQELISVYKPDVVGHLDKIRMHNKNRYFREDEPWYTKLVDETLSLIQDAARLPAGQGCRIEVNTRGIYKKRSDATFPGTWILKKVRELNIPVTITSDAHKPHELSLHLDETAGILKQLGFRGHDILTHQGWDTIRY
jgi:histidinol-phosphatase (PHP family)